MLKMFDCFVVCEQVLEKVESCFPVSVSLARALPTQVNLLNEQ